MAINRGAQALYEQWRANHPWAAPWRSPRRLLADRLPLLACHPDRIHQAWASASSGERYVNLDAIGIWVDGFDGQPSGYLIPRAAQEALLEELTLLRPPVRSMPGIAPMLTYRDLVAMLPTPVSPEVAQREAARTEILRLFGIPPDLVHPRYANIAPI